MQGEYGNYPFCFHSGILRYNFPANTFPSTACVNASVRFYLTLNRIRKLKQRTDTAEDLVLFRKKGKRN
jgi:hypothetical protein